MSEILQDLRPSSIYETAPLYVTEQRRFLNMVLAARTSLAPYDLLRRTQAVEAALGRDRSLSPPKGPRSLDIDLLLYADRIIRLERLTVPHPSMEERQFVLIPLLEIAPHLRHPVTGEAFREISRRLPDQGVYIRTPARYNTASAGMNPGTDRR